MAKPLILIDGSSWLFRAFYAIRQPLTSPDGEPTAAVFGMANMLRRLIKDYAPERIAIVFDPRGPTERTDIYAEYKANRDETPDELSAQFPLARALFETMGIPVLQIDRIEADDVIGTLVKRAREQDLEVLVVTADKDMAQLVDAHTHLLDTMKNRRLNPAGVLEKFGVPPERIVDWLTLVGDTSDNIPGVKGVGPKTAAKWLSEYGSLDALLTRADEIKSKAGESLRNFVDQIPLTRNLVTIRTNVPVPDIDTLRPQTPDAAALRKMFQRLGFKRWAEELDAADEAPAAETAEAAAAPKVTVPADVDYRTVLDAAALKELREALEAADLVCVDTETDALDAMRAGLVGLSFAVQSGQAWYVPVAHNYMGAPTQLSWEAVRKQLQPVLEDATKAKVGQNLKYDINVLHRHGVELRGVAHDTMLQSYVLDAAGNRHDMDTLAQQHLGHKTITFADIAGKGKAQLSFNQIDLAQAAPYAAEDADITLRLHQTLYPRLCETPALLKVYQTIEMPLVPVLAVVERNGVGIDAKALAALSKVMAKRMGELQGESWAAAGQEFNLGSPNQLQEILYGKLGLPVRAKTPKGKPSTAEDVLADLADEHPLPKLILEWRGLSKLRSTYADNLPKSINPDTGRIHTSYHQAVAATGRLSSADPNLQNIPIRSEDGRRIRQAFVAAKGHRLLAIDYSQIELRLMAHLSEDPRLQSAFKDGLDVHRATAAEVFDTALKSVTDDQRRAAKAINFGLIYGMSAFGLAKQLGIGRGDAQVYMDTFFARYPGVQAFMERTKAQAREQGYVETLLGRRLYLPNIKARNAAQRQYAERTAINAPLQGTAADLIKLAMVDVAAHLQASASPLRMIMQVHDELVFEGPQQAIADAAPELAQRMCRIIRLSVPLVADWGTGTQWDQAHSAEAQAVAN